jgi:hypothetical protein
MRQALVAAAFFLIAGASAPTVVYADDDDGYESGEPSEGAPVNPCAPETFNPDECVTPE